MSKAVKWILVLIILGGAAFLGYRYFFQDNASEEVVEEDTQEDVIVDLDDEPMDDLPDDTLVDPVEPVDTPEDETPAQDMDVEVGDTISGATAAQAAAIQSYGCSTESGVFTFEWSTSSNSGETPAVSSGTSGTDIVVTFDSLSNDRVATLSNASSLCGTKPVVSATREGEKSTYLFKDYSAKQFELSADKANKKVYLKITL